MRLIIREDPTQASSYIAQYIIGEPYSTPTSHPKPNILTTTDRIKAFNPTKEHPFVLGLPTGSSPVGIYKILVEKYKAGEISFENVVTFNMVLIPTPHSASSQPRIPSNPRFKSCC